MTNAPRAPRRRTPDPYRVFNFDVELGSVIVAGFNEVSGIESQLDFKTYEEGGLNSYVHVLPGRTKQGPNLTLKRGLTDQQGLWIWYQNVSQGLGTVGQLNSRDQRKNLTIYLKNSQGQRIWWWTFRRAFPIKWTGPQFKANDNTVAFETIELVHEGIIDQGVTAPSSR
jgi:phage tail-like protein